MKNKKKDWKNLMNILINIYLKNNKYLLKIRLNNINISRKKANNSKFKKLKVLKINKLKNWN
jgi:hypothetical protein